METAAQIIAALLAFAAIYAAMRWYFSPEIPRKYTALAALFLELVIGLLIANHTGLLG